MRRIESLLIPFEQYTLSTSMPVEQVCQRMLDHLEPKRSWSYTRSHETKPFQGKVSEAGFKIQQIIRYRNSFAPTIIGRYTTDKDRTFVHIRVRMPIVTLVFIDHL